MSLKWEEDYGHWQLVERKPDLPNGNLVWASIIQGRVCMMATFEMPLVGDEKVEKTFNFSGILPLLSKRYAMWRKRRALNKAQKWVEKQYKKYWEILGVQK